MNVFMLDDKDLASTRRSVFVYFAITIAFYFSGAEISVPFITQAGEPGSPSTPAKAVFSDVAWAFFAVFMYLILRLLFSYRAEKVELNSAAITQSTLRGVDLQKVHDETKFLVDKLPDLLGPKDGDTATQFVASVSSGKTDELMSSMTKLGEIAEHFVKNLASDPKQQASYDTMRTQLHSFWDYKKKVEKTLRDYKDPTELVPKLASERQAVLDLYSNAKSWLELLGTINTSDSNEVRTAEAFKRWRLLLLDILLPLGLAFTGALICAAAAT